MTNPFRRERRNFNAAVGFSGKRRGEEIRG
jgi:hypothetical protein